MPFDILLHLGNRLDIWLTSPECAPLDVFEDNDPSCTQPTSTISRHEYLDYSMKIFCEKEAAYHIGIRFTGPIIFGFLSKPQEIVFSRGISRIYYVYNNSLASCNLVEVVNMLVYEQ